MPFVIFSGQRAFFRGPGLNLRGLKAYLLRNNYIQNPDRITYIWAIGIFLRNLGKNRGACAIFAGLLFLARELVSRMNSK